MIRSLVAVMLLVLAPAARAAVPRSSISDELGFGATQPSPSTPRTGQVMDTLSGLIDLGSGWSLDLSASLTLTGGTKAVTGAEYGSRGGNTLSFSPGVIWEASDHLLFGMALSYSPRSTLRTDTTLTYDTLRGQPVEADALLQAVTSSSGARVTATYETAGLSDLETAVDLGIGITYLSSEQHILAARSAAGVSVTDQQILAYCSTHRCSKQLLGVLEQRSTTLDQTEVRLGLTETLHRDTDLGIGASYFFYDRDPTEIGLYGLAVAGRGASFGSAIPIAPLRWAIRPEVAHRFGDFSVRMWVRHGAYVDDEGTSNLVGVKLQYRFGRSFRMWIAASGQRDTDAQDNASTLFQSTLGTMWLF